MEYRRLRAITGGYRLDAVGFAWEKSFLRRTREVSKPNPFVPDLPQQIFVHFVVILSPVIARVAEEASERLVGEAVVRLRRGRSRARRGRLRRLCGRPAPSARGRRRWRWRC